MRRARAASMRRLAWQPCRPARLRTSEARRALWSRFAARRSVAACALSAAAAAYPAMRGSLQGRRVLVHAMVPPRSALWKRCGGDMAPALCGCDCVRRWQLREQNRRLRKVRDEVDGQWGSSAYREAEYGKRCASPSRCLHAPWALVCVQASMPLPGGLRLACALPHASHLDVSMERHAPDTQDMREEGCMARRADTQVGRQRPPQRARRHPPPACPRRPSPRQAPRRLGQTHDSRRGWARGRSCCAAPLPQAARV